MSTLDRLRRLWRLGGEVRGLSRQLRDLRQRIAQVEQQLGWEDDRALTLVWCIRCKKPRQDCPCVP